MRKIYSWIGVICMSGLVWSCQPKQENSTYYVQINENDKKTTEKKSFEKWQIEDSSKIINFPSGLKYYAVNEGNGNSPQVGQSVLVHYHGVLSDGTTFDSSFERGTPFETVIGKGQVIRGWDEGIPKMKVGGKAILIIPPELGYGDQPMGSIPPNSTLVFYVELLGIK